MVFCSKVIKGNTPALLKIASLNTTKLASSLDQLIVDTQKIPFFPLTLITRTKSNPYGLGLSSYFGLLTLSQVECALGSLD